MGLKRLLIFVKTIIIKVIHLCISAKCCFELILNRYLEQIIQL